MLNPISQVSKLRLGHAHVLSQSHAFKCLAVKPLSVHS